MTKERCHPNDTKGAIGMENRRMKPIKGVFFLWIRYVSIILILLISLYLLGASEEIKKVFILHSYHRGYQHTDDIQRAFEDIFQKEEDIECYIEYMDTLRNPENSYLEQLYALYLQKYTSHDLKFDLIMVSDDNAFSFLLPHRDTLFGNAPIVFCGLNDFDMSRLSGITGITGVNEQFSMRETLEIGLKMNPETKRIAIISGSRLSEKLTLESFKLLESDFRDRYEIVYLTEMNAETLKSELLSLAKDTIILYLSYLVDPAGKTYSAKEGIEIATVNPELMVFALNDMHVRNGIAGGKVVHAYSQGEIAAKIGLSLLREPKESSDPVIASPNRYLFDDAILQRFDISDDLIPKESILFNSRVDRFIVYWHNEGSKSFFGYDLFENHSAIMLLIDPLSGIIVDANKRAKEFYGYPRLIGMKVHEINTLDAESIREEMEKAVKEAKNYFRFKHRLSSGEIRDVAVYSGPVRIQESDYLFSTVYDISDQVKAEEQSIHQKAFLMNAGIYTILLAVVAIAVLFWVLRSRNKALLHAKYSEEKYRFLSEHSPAIVFQFEFDANNRIVKIPYVNESVKSVIGVSAEDIIRNPHLMLDKVRPEDRLSFRKKVEESAGTDKVLSHTFGYTQDGQERFVEAHFTPFRLEDEKVLWNGFFLDITERKEYEKKLLESNERLKIAMNSLDSMVYISDVETYELYFVNDKIEKEWGSELLGKPCWKVLQKGMAGVCPFCTNDKIIDGQNNPTDVYYWEFQNTLNDRWFGCRDRAIRWVNGRIARMEIATDITERKIAEEALKESERKFSSLFSSMAEMVALHDLVYDENGILINYRITDCNNAYTTITGIPRENAIGKLASEVYQSEPPPYLEEFGRVAITGEPLYFELFFELFNKFISVSVVKTGEKKFATVTTDITEIKKAEKTISDKNKELEQIIYVASHDLRSPLVNIDGYSRELEYAFDDFEKILSAGTSGVNSLETIVRSTLPELSESMRHIRNSAKQMDALLKGLLQLSRIGRAALNITTIDMNQLIASVISSIDYQISVSKAKIEVGALPPCKADEVQVTSVFSNLIGNAIKFLEKNRPGYIKIYGRVERNQSIYCVEDNGIGIPSDHYEDIFQLFHRLNTSRTEGEGLGLAIVRQIVNRLDGTIKVDSEPGAGSKFYVTLPGVR
jgi:PAS domain S-box-containing protein